MIADNKQNTQADNQSSHLTRISGADLPDQSSDKNARSSKIERRRSEPSEALLRALRAWHSVQARERTAPAA